MYNRAKALPIKFLSTLSLRRATGSPLIIPTIPVNFYPRSPCGERQGLGGDTAAAAKFLSTLSLRRATVLENVLAAVREFLSTLSLRRATGVWRDMDLEIKISIHALLAESDATTRSCGSVAIYFYPRSPCGERHVQAGFAGITQRISIHALLAESDVEYPAV